MNKQRIERKRRQKERENDMKLGEYIDFDNYVSTYKTNNNSLDENNFSDIPILENNFSDITILEKRKQNDEETLSELERKKNQK